MAIHTRAAVAAFAAAAVLVGCAGTPALMPTPAIYLGDTAKRLFTGANAEPATPTDAALPYTSDRSRSMAYGSVSVEIGESVAWPMLAEMSTESPRELPLEPHQAPSRVDRRA
jgi:hypothetical protein